MSFLQLIVDHPVISSVMIAVLVIGTLLVPARKERDDWTGSTLPPWSKRAVRQRLKRRRPLLLTYLAVLAATGIMLVVWALPSLLTERPRISEAKDRQTAINAARTGLVTLVAAIGAAAGLAYTARTYRLSREGHITDRYSKAVEQLGNDKIEVRLGGIYALERLMRDSPADQPTITETLAAYVRQHAPLTPAPVNGKGIVDWARSSSSDGQDHPVADVQAVLTVLGRRRPADYERPIYLAGTHLSGARFRKALLADVDLTDTHLVSTDFEEAELIHASLSDADLTEATLTGANLTGADLAGADLTDAILTGATLTDAEFPRATLRRTTFSRGALSPEQRDGALHADTIREV